MADWNTTGEVEVWKAVPGFDYYEASSLGRVKSLERVVVASGNRWGQVMRRRMRERIMKLKTSKRGYQSVALWRNGKTRIDKRLSRLILETLLDHAPMGWRHVTRMELGTTTGFQTSGGTHMPTMNKTSTGMGRISGESRHQQSN